VGISRTHQGGATGGVSARTRHGRGTLERYILHVSWACHDGTAPTSIRVRTFPGSQHHCHAVFWQLPQVSTMDPKSQRPKRQDVTLLLNAAIEAMNLAKEVSSMTPAKAVFGSVSIILTMIKVGFLLIRLDKPQANVSRIRWPTKPTTSSSG
jgi:hypothetical protein